MSEDVTPMGKVGPQLKVRRQAIRLSLAQVELDTKIRGKFLTALESGDYTRLPHDIYSRGFVQQYATYLGLKGADLAAAYVDERGGLAAGDTKRPRLARGRRLVFTGPILAAIGAIAIVGTIMSYLVYQFSSLAAPPHLVITSPGKDSTITGTVIEVVGHTTPGADVTINNSPILSDADGSFSEKVALSDGLNTIKIGSKSKLGKSSIVVRNVLAHLPNLNGVSASVPAAPFNGIAAHVSVSATTSIVISTDGKEVFRQTVLPGWNQLFTGSTSFVITTGNAGATNIVITNSTVANKKFVPLGSQGEIRRNQEFDATTTFE